MAISTNSIMAYPSKDIQYTNPSDVEKAITSQEAIKTHIGSVVKIELYQVAQQRADLQKELRDANADLADSITRLKNTPPVVKKALLPITGEN